MKKKSIVPPPTQYVWICACGEKGWAHEERLDDKCPKCGQPIIFNPCFKGGPPSNLVKKY